MNYCGKQVVIGTSLGKDLLAMSGGLRSTGNKKLGISENYIEEVIIHYHYHYYHYIIIHDNSYTV